MFAYHLATPLKSVSFFDSEGKIRFDPPVYELRYGAAIRILEDEQWKGQIKKVRQDNCFFFL